MIRRYGISDLDGVLQTWLQATKLAHGFLSDEFLAIEKANIQDIYLPRAQTWVWVEEGRVLGFVAVMGKEVGALFVHPERHGRGIGQALMNQAFALHDYLELDVFEANSIGRRFYARYGFTPFDRYVHHETGQPMLRLNLDKSASPPLER